MKQETLEEATSKWSLEKAQLFALSKFEKKGISTKGTVNWESILEVLKVGVLTGHKFGAKWQQERSYSEEEVRELLLTQRGNCYVAILTKTKDIELASLAMSAPEPSGKNGWVKQFKNK